VIATTSPPLAARLKSIPFGLEFAVVSLQFCGSMSLSAEEISAEIIAVQIRDQRYPCDKALSAKRDEKLSTPNEAAWILKCENAIYRVRLIPDMAAKVEKPD
jgi:hypothetical protein